MHNGKKSENGVWTSMTLVDPKMCVTLSTKLNDANFKLQADRTFFDSMICMKSFGSELKAHFSNLFGFELQAHFLKLDLHRLSFKTKTFREKLCLELGTKWSASNSNHRILCQQKKVNTLQVILYRNSYLLWCHGILRKRKRKSCFESFF